MIAESEQVTQLLAHVERARALLSRAYVLVPMGNPLRADMVAWLRDTDYAAHVAGAVGSAEPRTTVPATTQDTEHSAQDTTRKDTTQ